MNHFGFISPLLSRESSWDFLTGIIPEKWRYRRGPLSAGPITGYLSGEKLEGFGWKAPGSGSRLWSEMEVIRLWQRMTTDFTHKGIGIIGLDSNASLTLPVKLANQRCFPGISDGKALELLLFLNYFRGILRNYGVSSQKAKAMVIWEEGNLGLVCARLIAQEIRFLTLVHPSARLLERAADLIIAETGVSPRIYTAPPVTLKEKIIIKCGQFVRYQLDRHSNQAIWCEIFQKNPSLCSLNSDLPITVVNARHRLPLYPALGEAILRSFFNLQGFWYGPELQLERVIKLAAIFKELGVHIAV
jgi:hypothetical protein